MNNESRPYSHAVRALSVSIAFACRDGRSLQMIFSLFGNGHHANENCTN